MSTPSSASQVRRSLRIDSSRPDADLRVEAGERFPECLAGNGDVALANTVELFGVLQDRLDTAVAHGVADRPHHLQRSLDVEVGARHQGAVVGGGTGGTVPEVDPANHGPKSRRGSDPGRTPAKRRTAQL